eukprot:UN14191
MAARRALYRKFAPLSSFRLAARVSAAPQAFKGPRTFCSHPDFQPQSNVKDAPVDEVQEKLQQLVTDNNVVLFMKGNPDAPQCGFSRTVAKILEVEQFTDFVYVDVMKYPEVREGVRLSRTGRRSLSCT